jgi:glycosyltransferase involved in cell wall biosynthesis
MRKHLRITFILPGAGRKPVGGFKVVYEYANRLSRLGHRITVVHPALLQMDSSAAERARSVTRYLYGLVRSGPSPKSWFAIDPAVRLMWVPSLVSSNIPDSDVVIASAWQTAEWVATYPNSKGRKFYLIQQLETWHGMEDRVIATWRLPLRKFVIAHWLADFASKLNVSADYLPNGLDFERFYIVTPPEQRNPLSVMMLYHSARDKGSADGLKALSVVRQEVPGLTVTLFGTPTRPADLPSWIEYHSCPRQSMLRDLYNRSAVFVAPSWTEGWALPPAEAMMCGACLIATDIGGHRGYGIHEQTALLSPPRKPGQLAASILRVLRDNDLRLRLAAAGNNHVQRFTWQSSVCKMESILLQEHTT